MADGCGDQVVAELIRGRENKKGIGLAGRGQVEVSPGLSIPDVQPRSSEETAGWRAGWRIGRPQEVAQSPG